MDWTDAKVKQLRKLWDQGLSAAAIGRKLGVTKNAVVGKSHRLGLKSRPSPISGKPPAKPGKAAPKPKPKETKTACISDVIDLTLHTCRWPFGNPDDDDFHFCGRTVAQGKPYCEEHCAIAYVVKSGSRDRAS